TASPSTRTAPPGPPMSPPRCGSSTPRTGPAPTVSRGSGCWWSARGSRPRTSRSTPPAAPSRSAGPCAPGTGWCHAASAASRATSVLGGLNARIAETVIRRTVGHPADAGLPAPAAPLLEDAVIVSDDVLDRVREGRITPAGDITGVDAAGTVTHLGTGSHAGHLSFAPDLIVLATGYESRAAHFPEDLIPRTASGAPDLFLGAFARGRDDLVVLGQQQVSGGILPILVEQADIAAYMLAAVRDGSSPALERFRRIRAGSEA